MARIRKIKRDPGTNLRNYYLLDACFIANKHIALKYAPDEEQRVRLKACQDWWYEIEKQLEADRARVYIPDICIAESFKVLAKKFYEEKWYKKWSDFDKARKDLMNDIHVPIAELIKGRRRIKFHDVSTCRDLIISVDRFFELFMKRKKKVQIADLILVATAKYLMDFYDIPKRLLHIVTLDEDLWAGAKKVYELPGVYNPAQKNDCAEKVFE